MAVFALEVMRALICGEAGGEAVIGEGLRGLQGADNVLLLTAGVVT